MLLLLFVLPRISFSQVQISSVLTTVSTCANNGSIIVNASSVNPPLVYSIIAGPVTAPIQTNNIFNSLPAGTYTIKVGDFASNSLTQTAIIPGTYLQPDFNPIIKRPFCAGDHNGRLIGNNIPGTGTAPFTWQLIAPSPVTTPPQSSDTFPNLPAGNYTVRLTDACGSFRTMVSTIQDAPVSGMYYAITPYVYMVGCDSAIISTYIETNLYRYPLTYTYQTNVGTFTYVTPDQTDSSSFDYGPVVHDQLIPGFGHNDNVTITVTDACGSTLVSPMLHAQGFNFCQGLFNYFENCNYHTSINFDLNNPACQSIYTMWTYAHAPLIYQVTSTATGAVMITDTVPGYPDANGNYTASGVSVANLPGNTDYVITITDACGNVFNNNFYMPEYPIPDPFVSSKTVYPDGCVDSSAFSFINVENFRTEPKLIFLSGPATMGSTKPGYEYQNSYQYPDTIPVGGYGATTYRFDIEGLSVGTYYFKVYDTCGTALYDSLVVLPTEVTDFGHHFWYRRGCLGRNELHYTVNSNSGQMFVQSPANNFNFFTVYQTQDWLVPNSDSILNLGSGTYLVNFTYAPYFNGAELPHSPIVCQQITDTVVIEGYQTPTILNGNYIQCQSNIHLELMPDSSRGVPPYQYEIIAGPQTFPVQNSNLFDIISPGVYTVRIYDVCGNGSTAQITVDPIIFPPVTVLPFSCNSTSLTYGSSIYYTYHWIHPDGSVYTGDTLIIDPVTPADTGIYTIIKIVNINGCIDTFYSTYHVALNNVTEQNITICSGNSITVGTHTYNTTGIYADTLTNVYLCDSIVILNLTVVQFLRDTIRRSLCYGQSYTMNGHVYSQTGIYHDTLVIANSCDSIITLDLTVFPIIRDSILRSVCYGQSYSVNGNAYNQTGIYYDTLSATNSCDSVVILNLTVFPIIRDSILRSVCYGQSYSVNGNVYNQTGIYYDTLSATNSCDSVVILNLTVEPIKRDSILRSVCFGQSFAVNGHVYNQTGIYHDTLSTANSCDSIVILNLTIEPIVRDSILRSVCFGQSYTVNGHVYNQTGIYHDTLSATNSCDSIVILNLTVEPIKRDSILRSVCFGQSYTVNGHVYNQTGIYHDTLSAANSCDSIVILNLTIEPIIRDSILRSICFGENYAVNGHVYTQPGIYSDTLSAANSCDSLVILNLSVLPLKRDSITKLICSGQSFTFNNHEYTQNGIYYDTLSTATCDSIVTLSLMVLPPMPVSITASEYTVNEGDVIQLSSTQSQSYLWTSVIALISDPAIQNPTAIMNNSGWIYLNTVSNLAGCTSGDSVFIKVIKDSLCKGAYIHMPNAFTPNHDLINEVFKINSNKILLSRFVIYNRWGEKVFETTNLNEGWDGSYKGKTIQDAYVYMISYHTDCNKKIKMLKGSIILIR